MPHFHPLKVTVYTYASGQSIAHPTRTSRTHNTHLKVTVVKIFQALLEGRSVESELYAKIVGIVHLDVLQSYVQVSVRGARLRRDGLGRRAA